MPIETAKYNQEELRGFGFRTIAVIVLGNYTFLLKQNQDALLAVEPIDSNSQRDYFTKEVDRLTAANQIQIPGVDPDQIDIVQINNKKGVEIRWAEKTSGPDEPTITLQIKDCLTFNERAANLSEQEIIDLFVPAKGRNRAATFFLIDTAEQEVIGIALRRASPKILLLPPSIEGSKFSTLGGFLTVLDSLYTRLIEHTTQIQSQVDNLVFEASLPTKKQIVFAAESNNKRQAEFHKKILQIQALLVALKADPRLGSQDPKVLDLLPILRQENKQGGGLFGGGRQNQAPKSIMIDNSIWETLLEKPGQGFIATSARPARPQVQATPPRPQPTPQPARVETRPAPTEVRPQKTEKEKALTLAREIEDGLQNSLKLFSSTYSSEIGLKQVQELNDAVQRISQASQRYTNERKRGKPPVTPIPTRIQPQNGIIKIGGAKDESTFEFLTGNNVVTDYRQKIEAAFDAWQNMVLPIFRNTSSRTERLLTSLVKNNELAGKFPNVKNTLIPQLIAYIRQTQQKEAYSGELAHVILVSQVMYILWARFQELKNCNDPVEIDNWANYCYNTMERAKQLTIEILKK